jgi:hypothetical protein
MRIQPSQTCCATIRDQNAAVFRSNTCRLWEAIDSSKMTARVRVDNFNAVASRVGDENAAAVRLERAVIKFSAT